MTLSSHTNIINACAFQVIWWAGVLAGNQLVVIPALLIVWHFIVSKQKRHDVKVMFTCGLLGVLVDSLLTMSGFFDFAVFPLWLGLLWGYFAISLNYSLGLFNHLPIAAQSLLGGIFGSLSYIGGANLGAVELPHGLLFSALGLFFIWSLLFPMFLQLAKIIGLKHSRTVFEKSI